MGLDTLANVKERLNITNGDYDAFLQTQIDLVSDAIEGYLRRKVLQTTYTQHFYKEDYRRSLMLELYAYPIASVASIVEDTVPLDSSNWRLHKPSGRITRLDFTAFFWASETIVTYTAGLADVPNPVLSVLDSCVQERYNKQSSGVSLNFGSDVQRISLPGSLSIDFDYTTHNNDQSIAFGVILGNNCNILDPYRSHRTVIGDSRLVFLDEFPEGNP